MRSVLNTFFGKKMRDRTITYLIVIVAFIVMQTLSATGGLSRLLRSLLVPVCCYTVAAIGLNLNIGISGELNLGQAGFMSVGGFAAAIFAAWLGEGVPAPIRLILCILLGAFMAGFIGWLISIPVLKLKGDYLAIVTLAFGQIIMTIFNNLYVGLDEKGLHFSFLNNHLEMSEAGRTIIGGPMGASGIQTIASFTAGFILILFALFLVFNLMYSKSGRAVMACRDNRIAAETVGINVAKTKTLAFVISSALGGMAGALYMLNFSSVTATKFDFNLSIMILVYVVLGGLGNIKGTIIATALLVVLPEMLRFLSGYRMLLYAVILIVIMLLTNNERIRTFLKRLRERFGKGRKEAAHE